MVIERGKENDCKDCRLHKTRSKVVFGRGNKEADIVFCGEAPGRDEDETGRPFVGKAGKLLNIIIKGIGLNRKDVFITNACLCRPPNNRRPFPSEIKACRARLLKTLRQRGKLVVLLGRSASKAVLGCNDLAWGRPYYSKKIKKFCVTTKHPSWYLYGNQKYLHFGIIEIKSAIEEAKQLSRFKREERRKMLCKIS